MKTIARNTLVIVLGLISVVTPASATSRAALLRALNIPQTFSADTSTIRVQRVGNNRYELWNGNGDYAAFVSVSYQRMNRGEFESGRCKLSFRHNQTIVLDASVVTVEAVDLGEDTGYMMQSPDEGCFESLPPLKLAK